MDRDEWLQRYKTRLIELEESEADAEQARQDFAEDVDGELTELLETEVEPEDQAEADTEEVYDGDEDPADDEDLDADTVDGDEPEDTDD